MYIYIYIYTHTHTHTYTCVYVCACMCMYIYIYIYVPAPRPSGPAGRDNKRWIHILKAANKPKLATNNVYMYVCVYIYIYIYTRTYIHTYIHAYIHIMSVILIMNMIMIMIIMIIMIITTLQQRSWPSGPARPGRMAAPSGAPGAPPDLCAWPITMNQSYISKGIWRTGHRLFCKGFLCFNNMPCRPMPLLVHFWDVEFLYGFRQKFADATKDLSAAWSEFSGEMLKCRLLKWLSDHPMKSAIPECAARAVRPASCWCWPY